MFKSLRKSGFWFMVVAIAQIGAFALSRQVVLADSARIEPTDPVMDPSLGIGSIIGMAQLERRTTVVPEVVCPRGETCAQPETYWVLVLRDGNVQYLVDEAFARGSESAPESVDLAGVRIRAGSQVAVQAKADIISKDYVIVSEIDRVSILKEKRELNEPSIPHYGWTCQDRSGSEVRLRADAWYTLDQDGKGVYKVRVLAFQTEHGERTVYPLIHIEHAEVSAKRDQLVYTGSSEQGTIELSIDQKVQAVQGIPSELNLDLHYNLFQSYFPLDTRVKMACARTR